MERTSKRSGFKLRSGNKPSMSKLAGASPMKKTSFIDKLKAASKAISTSKGPFGDTSFVDRYKEEKRKARVAAKKGKKYNPGKTSYMGTT